MRGRGVRWREEEEGGGRGRVCVQLGLSLEDNRQTCLVHKQTNRDCASRATTTLTDPLHQACSTNRKKINKDAAARQQTGRNNLVNVGR